MVSSNKSRTFAVLLRKERLRAVENRDVVQLVVYLVWDQGVARSSRVIPTNKGRFGSERLPYKQRVGGSNPSAPTQLMTRFFPCHLFCDKCYDKKSKNISCSTLLIVFVPHKIRIFALRIE